ncbi:hypothetical protein [Psychromonas ossibalaenae]|nr:hypothetical protein [Psychromonas ossibalaenae]
MQNKTSEDYFLNSALHYAYKKGVTREKALEFILVELSNIKDKAF